MFELVDDAAYVIAAVYARAQLLRYARRQPELNADERREVYKMALPFPVGEEGKMLSEALGIVKIQTQQMKRYLASTLVNSVQSAVLTL